MQIGEVADRVGLSLRTVRYYEELGIVTPIGRTTGGFRLYDDAAVERLSLVRDLKPLGFTLEEIREIVELATTGGAVDPDRVREFADRARTEHARALRSLGAAERMIETLERIGGTSGG